MLVFSHVHFDVWYGFHDLIISMNGRYILSSVLCNRLVMGRLQNKLLLNVGMGPQYKNKVCGREDYWNSV